MRLDRYDLDADYAGECAICGEDMFWSEEITKASHEYCHAGCKAAMEAEAALLQEWAAED